MYLWVGNLPASIRKRRGGKGGAYLVGYLPKVCRASCQLDSSSHCSISDPAADFQASKASEVRDLATFRCKVYHDALNIIFESLKLPARHGAPMQCGDGVIRTLVPVISAGSADYMELYVDNVSDIFGTLTHPNC